MSLINLSPLVWPLITNQNNTTPLPAKSVKDVGFAVYSPTYDRHLHMLMPMTDVAQLRSFIQKCGPHSNWDKMEMDYTIFTGGKTKLFESPTVRALYHGYLISTGQDLLQAGDRVSLKDGLTSPLCLEHWLYFRLWGTGGESRDSSGDDEPSEDSANDVEAGNDGNTVVGGAGGGETKDDGSAGVGGGGARMGAPLLVDEKDRGIGMWLVWRAVDYRITYTYKGNRFCVDRYKASS